MHWATVEVVSIDLCCVVEGLPFFSVEGSLALILHNVVDVLLLELCINLEYSSLDTDEGVELIDDSAKGVITLLIGGLYNAEVVDCCVSASKADDIKNRCSLTVES